MSKELSTKEVQVLKNKIDITINYLNSLKEEFDTDCSLYQLAQSISIVISLVGTIHSYVNSKSLEE